MSRREQACRPIERRPEVITSAFFCCTSVQGCTNSDRADFRGPSLGPKRPLSIERRRKGIRGMRKSCTEGIPNSLEDIAAVLFNGSAQQHIVPGQSELHSLRCALPKLRASLNIREQKSNGSSWKMIHDITLRLAV